MKVFTSVHNNDKYINYLIQRYKKREYFSIIEVDNILEFVSIKD